MVCYRGGYETYTISIATLLSYILYPPSSNDGSSPADKASPPPRPTTPSRLSALELSASLGCSPFPPPLAPCADLTLPSLLQVLGLQSEWQVAKRSLKKSPGSTSEVSSSSLCPATTTRRRHAWRGAAGRMLLSKQERGGVWRTAEGQGGP